MYIVYKTHTLTHIPDQTYTAIPWSFPLHLGICLRKGQDSEQVSHQPVLANFNFLLFVSCSYCYKDCDSWPHMEFKMAKTRDKLSKISKHGFGYIKYTWQSSRKVLYFVLCFLFWCVLYFFVFLYFIVCILYLLCVFWILLWVFCIFCTCLYL